MERTTSTSGSTPSAAASTPGMSTSQPTDPPEPAGPESSGPASSPPSAAHEPSEPREASEPNEVVAVIRPPLVRRSGDGVVGGVAAGLAAHLGVPVKVVRIAFVATTIPFGAGLAVYVFLWATMRNAPVDELAPVLSTAGTGPAATEPAANAERASASRLATPKSWDTKGVKAWLRNGNEAVLLALLGIGAIVLAGVLWLGGVGISVNFGVVIPIVAIGIGAIFFWSQLDDTTPIGTRRPVRWIWLAVGLVLTSVGLVGLLVRGTNFAELWQVTGAVLAALVGVAVLAAPWILRLWSNLREEQAARIRETERADIAAHLHDSVLQTLALIQRRADDPASVARLARAQERQLRSYLYDEDARAGTLSAALTAALAEVDDLHGVPVELVVTGDHTMDEHLDALVKAIREAAWNAVRHASPPISVYVEAGPTTVEAFVRDHGSGFDLDDVPDDRAGVRESVIGRMERHGGTARIRNRGDGTEVELCLPVTSPSQAPTAASATSPNASPDSSPDSSPDPGPTSKPTSTTSPMDPEAEDPEP